MIALLLSLVACDGADKTETGAPDDTDTGAPDDTDTGDTDETGDTDSGDTDSGDTDSGDPPVEPCPDGATVTFEHTDGATEDVTDALLTGTYLTLDAPGRLLVCPGTWYARVLARASVEVVGLGADPEDTVLSAGEVGTILDILGPDVAVTASNVTFDRGAGLDPDHNSGGGGIYCNGYGAVSVYDSVFTNNFANDGAGLYASDCEVTLEGVTFADNLSEDDGGAFTLWYSNATLTDVTFRDNEALDGGGMAMFYSTATLTNVTFENNRSGYVAGGLWGYYSDLVLQDVAFTGNVNTGADAGGLLVYGSAVMDNVTFTDNSAPRGGGLFVYWQAVIDATSCDFAGNSPEDIFVADYSEAGGQSVTAGADYSFACAANVCTPG